MVDKKVIFILGSGHCGSTLLDLLLSSHSLCFGLGELAVLKNHYHQIFNQNLVPTILDKIDDFWTQEFLSSIKNNFSCKSRIRRIIRRMAGIEDKMRFRLYQKLFERSRAEILVDSSKHILWVSISIQSLRNCTSITPILIFLKRDPRAVISSFYRKQPEREFEEIVEWHCAKMKQLETYFESFSGLKMELDYKTLATETEAALRKICERACISFEDKIKIRLRHLQ